METTTTNITSYQQSVIFLFGAGASIHAGLSGVIALVEDLQTG
jgi:hypothetical protein